MVHNDVIKNFIGSFQVLSERKLHKNKDGRQFFKWTNEIVDDIIMNQWNALFRIIWRWSLRDNLPIFLRDSFHLAPESTTTRGALMHKLVLPKVRTLYGLNSVTYQSTAAWNYILSVLPTSKVHSVSKATCKENINEYFIKSYTWVMIWKFRNHAYLLYTSKT